MGLYDLGFTVFFGGLAQLARAPALHAGGHRFDSDILHGSIVFYKFERGNYRPFDGFSRIRLLERCSLTY